MIREKNNKVKKIIMMCLFSILFLLMCVNISPAEEKYKGMLIVEKDGKHEIDNEDHVELTLGN